MIDAFIHIVRWGVALFLVFFGIAAALCGKKDRTEGPRTPLDKIRRDMRSIEPPPLRKRMN